MTWEYRREKTSLVAVLAAAAVILQFSANAQLVGDPAGPRRGVVYELALRPPDPAAIEELARLGFNIGHVTPDHVDLFATAGEYEYLVRNGYPVTLQGMQPSPPDYPAGTRGGGLGTYHSYAEVTSTLQAYASAYPGLTRLISLGQSVDGRDLWAILISDNPLLDEIEPEFKYVSTMHGDEPVGTEMCLYFIDHLLTNYGVDSTITDLVNNTAIWIVPLMNPDGLEDGTRNNANGFDLNRSFPNFPEDYTSTIWNLYPDSTGYQPEVRRLMDWSAANSFVLSANLHTGAVVVSYPYDADPPLPTFVPAPTPDDALFVAMSTDYASLNPPMFSNDDFPFENGIVNGNDWYIVTGGMLDWMYRYLGTAEVTVELSVPKRPNQNQLPNYWDDNRDSMLAYLSWVHRGVRGTVTDIDTGDPVYAYINVAGNPQPVFPDMTHGDYYRILLPGTYDLQFQAVGYEPLVVEDVAVTSGAATVVNVQMIAATNLSGMSPVVLGGLASLLLVLGTALLRRSTV